MLVRMWIHEILDATLQVLKPSDLIPKDFNYTMKWSDAGSITIASEYRDPLIAKKFLETVANIFNPITEEKYKLISTHKKLTEVKSVNMNRNNTVILLFVPYIA